MKLPRPWEPQRRWGLFILSRCVHYDFLGSGYKHLRYKDSWLRRYFWTRKQAQRMADALNGVDHGIDA